MASDTSREERGAVYNTRDLVLKDTPFSNSSSTTAAAAAPRRESGPDAGKGHYGHREADTSHLRSNAMIPDRDADNRTRPAHGENGAYRDTAAGPRDYSERSSNGGDADPSRRTVALVVPPDNDHRNGDASDGGAVVVPDRMDARRGRERDRDRDRARDTGRDTSREMIRAVAVYERSYMKLKEERVVPSVRKRHYDHMHMEDALQDKVATQLRENGVAETRVPVLSAKIAQAVRDDVIDASQGTSPQVTQHLREAIHNHLDPLLYNKTHATDLGVSQKTSDAPHLANIVLIRLGQVHEEAESCKQSVEVPPKTNRRGYSPREESDRSILMQIKDGVTHQKTENDILQDKLKKALRDHDDIEDDKDRQQREAEELSAENWQLARDLKEAETDRESLIAKVREQQTDYERLDKAYMELKAENFKMKKQLADSDTSTHSLSTELARLHAEKARLQVLLDQKEKEILRLRDPDKEMVHNLRILQDEVTLLRTQTRRLNEEKGLLRSRSQRMENSLDESHKARNKLTMERDNLVRENQDLRQRYRRVALATPQLRALPDIMAGKNGPASSRTTSRAPSRVYRSREEEKERRASPAPGSKESQRQ